MLYGIIHEATATFTGVCHPPTRMLRWRAARSAASVSAVSSCFSRAAKPLMAGCTEVHHSKQSSMLQHYEYSIPSMQCV